MHFTIERSGSGMVNHNRKCSVCGKWVSKTVLQPDALGPLCAYLGLDPVKIQKRFLRQGLPFFAWIVGYLEDFLDVPPKELDPARFARYGFVEFYQDISDSQRFGFLEELIICALHCEVEEFSSYPNIPLSRPGNHVPTAFRTLAPQWDAVEGFCQPSVFRYPLSEINELELDLDDEDLVTLYHGTCLGAAEGILSREPGEPYPIRRRGDFGTGLYLTDRLDTALFHAKRKQSEGNPGTILCYRFMALPDQFKVLNFYRENLEGWEDLIRAAYAKKNIPKSLLKRDGIQLDVVIGPTRTGSGYEEWEPVMDQEQHCFRMARSLDFLTTALSQLWILEPEQPVG